MDSARELRWDITAVQGSQGEMFVSDLLRSLRAGSVDVEVKHDLESQNTGNIYLEYEAYSRRTKQYEPSGIKKTESKAWAIVLEKGQLVVCISVDRLRQLGRAAYRRHGIVEQNRSANPTRGVLIPLTDLISAGTHAMRSTLLR